MIDGKDIFALASKQPTEPGLMHLFEAFPFCPLNTAQMKLIDQRCDRVFLAFQDDPAEPRKAFGPTAFEPRLIRAAVRRAHVLCVWSGGGDFMPGLIDLVRTGADVVVALTQPHLTSAWWTAFEAHACPDVCRLHIQPEGTFGHA